MQDITKKYLDPEPYQAEPSGRPLGSLWQNLAQGSTARSAVAYTTERVQPSTAASWHGKDNSATARQEVPVQQEKGPTNANGWTLPRYPTQENYGQARNNLIYNPPAFANMASERSPLVISQSPGLNAASGMYDTGFNQAKPVTSDMNPALSYNRLDPIFDNVDQQSFPSSNQANQFETRMSGSDDLMSPYMEAPPPPAAQDNVFSEENTIATDLQRLFNQRKMDIFSSDSFRPLPASDSPPSRPQTFGNGPTNRRNDNTLGVKQAAGFWNSIPQRTQTTSTEAGLANLQNEIDRLMAIESQNNIKVKDETNSV